MKEIELNGVVYEYGVDYGKKKELAIDYSYQGEGNHLIDATRYALERIFSRHGVTA